jgi:hypothetical protein
MNKPYGLFVATPVHSQVSMHYMQACLNLQSACIEKQFPIQFCLLQDSVLTQNRNRCVKEFLKTDDRFTHLLFIDSDIYFNVQSIFQMMAVDRDVISMPYPMKQINYAKMWDKIKNNQITNVEELEAAGYDYPVKVKDDKSILDKHGVMEISHLPTGALLIKKEVFYKLINAYPELKITKNVDEPYYNFFDFYHDKNEQAYYGEDFGFSKLWTKLDGKCYAYIMDKIAHIGDHAFYGKLYDNLTYKKPLNSK